MLAAFFLTPWEIVAAFVGGVLALLGIGAKANKRGNGKKGGKRK